MAGYQAVDEEQQRGGRGQLGGVDGAVYPEGRLLRVRTGDCIGDGSQPDISPFMAGANALHLYEGWMLLCEGMEEAREVVVAVIGIEAEAGQGGWHEAGV